MRITTEIVTMKTTGGVSKGNFIGVVDGLEKNFHSKQPGFIDSELLYNDKSGEWVMIQHWDGIGNLKAASKKMFGNPVTEAFVKSLRPDCVKMLILPCLGMWNGEGAVFSGSPLADDHK